jgi:hypothetical protein
MGISHSRSSWIAMGATQDTQTAAESNHVADTPATVAIPPMIRRMIVEQSRR